MKATVQKYLVSNRVKDVSYNAADRHSEHVVEKHALKRVFVN
jgi:hypothetical protein